MMQPDQDRVRRQERLARAGELMFGTRYQTNLAEQLLVSQSTVAQVVGGKIDVSVELEARLRGVILRQARELSNRAIDLAEIAVQITDDRRPRFAEMIAAQAEIDEVEASYNATANQTTSPPGPIGKSLRSGVAKAPARKGSHET